MRLFEAIIDANHRAVAGDQNAGLHPADFESEFPIVALTCIDVRLNALLPEVLGVPKEEFIWLRNAGNIITGPMSSTMRSLALACAIKGGKEIAIIGHTDCQVGKTTAMGLIEGFKKLGVERNLLPANMTEFFGMFASEASNVIKAADIARQSPLLGPKVPVHGLLVNIETGKVEWLVNGYDTLANAGAQKQTTPGQVVDALKSLTDLEVGGIDFPTSKIGEGVAKAEEWLAEKVQEAAAAAEKAAAKSPLVKASFEQWRREKGQAKPEVPPKIPLPPPMRPRLRFQRKRK